MVSPLERTFLVDGMHCKSCKELIEEELAGMDCVEDAQVSLEEGITLVVMKDDCTELIVETIQSLGYSARVQE